MPFLFSAHLNSRSKSCHKRRWFCTGRGGTSAGASASCAMVEKAKSGGRVGDRTRWCVRHYCRHRLNYRRLTGNCLGILAHSIPPATSAIEDWQTNACARPTMNCLKNGFQHGFPSRRSPIDFRLGTSAFQMVRMTPCRSPSSTRFSVARQQAGCPTPRTRICRPCRNLCLEQKSPPGRTTAFAPSSVSRPPRSATNYSPLRWCSDFPSSMVRLSTKRRSIGRPATARAMRSLKCSGVQRPSAAFTASR